MSTGASGSPPDPAPAFRQAAGRLTDNTLLCFWQSQTTANNLVTEIGAAGWQVIPVDDAHQVNSLAERHRVPVGMLFVDSTLPDDRLDAIYAAISATDDMVWLGLLSDRRRMSDEVCNLVATGCNDFFTPPYDSRRILETLGHAAGLSRIRHRSLEYRHAPETFHGMIGESPPMRRLFRQLSKVAKSDAPVLLTGASGTGKELAANAVHRLSARASMPFVAVNCAALPSTLVQAELFGHEKGAFTGADRRRVGRLEEARGGVLFLDEIGDMPLEQQVNLLRFLEHGQIERLGGNGKVELDLRIITATHEDLEEAVARGTFREDLYYRLNVLRVDVPALAERGEDIDLLARAVLERYGAESGVPRIRGIDRRCRQAMQVYHWPGNVRELINRVRGAMVLADGSYLTARDLGLAPAGESSAGVSLEVSRAQSDRRCIEAALQHSQQNMSRAARELGISRTTLYRMMEKLEIPHP